MFCYQNIILFIPFLCNKLDLTHCLIINKGLSYLFTFHFLFLFPDSSSNWKLKPTDVHCVVKEKLHVTILHKSSLYLLNSIFKITPCFSFPEQFEPVESSILASEISQKLAVIQHPCITDLQHCHSWINQQAFVIDKHLNLLWCWSCSRIMLSWK